MSGDVGRWRKVFTAIWFRPDFLDLNDFERTVVFYLLTGPQSNRIGLYLLSLTLAAEHLRVSPIRFRKALDSVCVTFGWLYDSHARVLYIPTWWRWNPPSNEKHTLGNMKDLCELPPCALIEAFARNVDDIPPAFREAYTRGLLEYLPRGSRNQKKKLKLEAEKGTEDGVRANSARTSDGREGDADAGNKLHDVRLLSIAKETLGFLDRNADEETRVSTFYQVARSRQYSPEPRRADVLDVLNVAQRATA
jgi:hypothetical protein